MSKKYVKEAKIVITFSKEVDRETANKIIRSEFKRFLPVFDEENLTDHSNTFLEFCEVYNGEKRVGDTFAGVTVGDIEPAAVEPVI